MMRNKHSIEKMKINFNGGETVLKGRAVSRGVGIGKTLCLHGRKRQFYRVKLHQEQIEKELRRFRAAVRLAQRQLRKISSPDIQGISEHQANIFETHQLFLEDRSLLSKIESTIIEQKVNAEWAVKVVTDTFIAKYKTLSDKHLREKYIDLEDITERLLTALGGGKKSTVSFDKDTIVIAKEINPSTLIELSQNNPKALVTENGGWTSHTFILARELNLPAVTGVKNILRRVETGENIVVNGFNGQIILNPENKTIDKYKVSEEDFERSNIPIFASNDKILKTLDGFEMTVRANLDLPNKYQTAKNYGAKGIGLYRSEFLFNQNKGFPSEKEQFESYKDIAKLVGNSGIRIRTFDLSVDQLANQGGWKENNPALGLRGIRLSIKLENEFRRQIRALLRASYNTQIDIILPLISDVSEIIWAKNILSAEKEKLRLEGIDFGDPKLGSMVEVPAAVLSIDKILEEADFISVGTNDLVQYILGVDRDNEDVADWFRTLHPAVLKSIKIVLDAANAVNKPAIICGEMAGSPLYVPILIAYGARELSMNLNSISRVRKVISNIAREEAKEIVKELEKCKTSDEVENLVSKMYSEKWKHLFDSETLPVRSEETY